MSRHWPRKCTREVATYLLHALVREDTNVVTADEEQTKCLAAVDYHRERAPTLRAALRSLGTDVGAVAPNEARNYE